MRSKPTDGTMGRRLVGLMFAAAWLCAAVAAQSLRMNGTEIVPSRPVTETELSAVAGSTGETVAIVQFSGPIQSEWIAALQDNGIVIHQYVPDYAYLVSMPPRQLKAARAVSGLRWVGLLPAASKVSPRLAAKALSAGQEKGAPGVVDALVLSASDEAIKQLEGKGYEIKYSRVTPMGWLETHVSLPLAKVSDVASINSVFRIEERPVNELHGERGAQTVAGQFNPGATAPTGPGYATWLASQGLSGGSGIVVEVQDDGIDKGISTNLPGTAHADILGRIVGIFNATSDSNGGSRAGHGQINAGIIAGNATIGTTDGAGYKLGMGVAPAGLIYGTKIFRNDGFFDIGSNTFTSLAKRAQDAGAIFSNNSWGANVNGEYDSQAAEFDALTRDSDLQQPGNQPMVYFFSAGNSGPNANTLGSPATAKNVIAVGAGENSDADGTDGCGVTPQSSNSIRDLVNFSSRGPTDDGRFGVTLFSVGTHVQGPASTIAGYDGTGVCDQYWPIGQTHYARSSGTSHSCPLACGAGVIVYELFNTQLVAFGHTPNPGPALIKAVLTNTATDMAGGSNGAGGMLTNIPNAQQGWGAVNLKTLMDKKDALYSLDQTHLFTSSGQTFEVTLRRASVGSPFKVTLAWTDAPGVPGAGTALVNDLDLEVVDGATTYRGNVFVNGSSTSGGTADRKNNLEAVFIPSPVSNELLVRVRAFNIAGNGVPNAGTSTDQDFALFAWNATTQGATGTLNLVPSLVNCNDTLVISVSDADLQGAGVVNVTIGTSTGDVETVALAETSPSSGTFAGSIFTASGAPVSDGKVQVSDGAAITATYNDAADNSGNPAVVQAQSTANCSPPIVSNVQTSVQAGTLAVITFQTNETATSRVRFGTACGALNRTVNAVVNGLSHTATLSDLDPSTDYFFAVEATDESGNTAIANNGGACFSFRTPQRPDYFTEWFDAMDNDIDNQTLVFTPDQSLSKYSVCRVSATSFPTDHAAHTVILNNSSSQDDAFATRTLSNNMKVKLYGVEYGTMYVGSNGYITFSSGDTTFEESAPKHFEQPRISALFDDLVPAPSTPVKFAQLADRVVVTWVGLGEFRFGGSPIGSNYVQVEMFFDGQLRVTHLNIDAADGLVGLSKGGGLPADFADSDLSAGYPLCATSFQISGTVTHSGVGPLAGVTINGLPGSPVTDASGQYSAVVPAGFSGTATPQKTGFSFSPSSRTYTNVSGNQTSQNYTATEGVLSVTPSNRDVGSDAGMTMFSVSNLGSGSMNWIAQVTNGGDWLSIASGFSGTNSGTITLSFTANPLGTPRQATVRVTATGAAGSPRDVTVTQAGAPFIGVNPTSRNVSAAAGDTTFTVSNTGQGTLNWSAEVVSGGDWLFITDGGSGTNFGTISVAFLLNTTNGPRSGTIRITAAGAGGSPRDVTVNQATAGILNVTPNSRELGVGPGQTTFNVSNSGGAGMPWQAEVLPGGGWLAITGGSSGTDSGVITVAFGSNSDSQARTATIRVSSTLSSNGPVDVTVTQAGRAFVTVVAPNGGEVIVKKERISILWTSGGNAGDAVRIELWQKNFPLLTIAESTPNDGLFRFKFPKTVKGKGFQIRIASLADPSAHDFSDKKFKVVKAP